ncbi:MAG: NUDIX domain-containing protein, partial [bacterium]|nr:NUDIX domain-containing protein [bacterium]
MHWIQKQTLKKLIVDSELRFSELKPEDVESNLFMYHLRELLRSRLVTKAARGYRLSATGKRYADKLSWKTLSPRVQPKIVTMVACRNRRDEWLVYRRRRQPFRGLISFPHGKLHLGENIQEAAERELSEKAQLQGRLHHRGDAYLSVYQDTDLISQA